MTIRQLVLAAIVAALAASAAASHVRADDHGSAVSNGVTFIRSTQDDTGGFGPFGQTVDAIIAMRAAGLEPGTVRSGSHSAEDFFAAHIAEAGESPALAAKAALGAMALDLDPTQAGGTDLTALTRSGFDPSTGLYTADAFSQALVILGLACTGNEVPDAAYDALRIAAVEDGGWGFAGASDPDTTALSIQALLTDSRSGEDAHIEAALNYLETTQMDDGGWGYGESNTSSTAFVVQAALAAGFEPATRFTAGDPISYLLSQQGDDGGFAGYDRGFATNQVVPALAGRSYCDAPATPVTGPAPGPPNAGTGIADPDRPSPVPAAGGVGRLGLALVILTGVASLTARRR